MLCGGCYSESDLSLADSAAIKHSQNEDDKKKPLFPQMKNSPARKLSGMSSAEYSIGVQGEQSKAFTQLPLVLMGLYKGKWPEWTMPILVKNTQMESLNAWS